jgi:hypothetical protein
MLCSPLPPQPLSALPQLEAFPLPRVRQLKINGNNPAQWPLKTPWSDNLGALFTHGGQSETIYSTSTVDVTQSGTTTLDYWAVVPSTQAWLHATRAVVVNAAANDSHISSPATTTAASTTPPDANDNTPITPRAATGTDATTSATSTAQ